ncbi:siderophore-interacting protein [Silvibacterium acidisoli]|uniref:siderophore-interacting protein n=1 Tax=Acidobacteriaceae bacterium ZG23-2 TaxID=2883246 RepID=UPI00406D304B
MQKHEITKVRREPVRRTLTVAAKEFLTPRMLRIRFRSEELEGFDSPSPDDHIKLFFLSAEGEEVRRDFTPRAWDVATGTFTIDFALHQHGPAADWARNAKDGDTVQIAGPRGSTVVPDDFDWYLLIGDACAIPSFSRRLQEMRANVPVFTYILVDGWEDKQVLETKADRQQHWLLRGESSSHDAEAIRTELDKQEFPAGDGYVWVAGETEFSREIYNYLIEKCGHSEQWIKAAAYWTRSEG